MNALGHNEMNVLGNSEINAFGHSEMNAFGHSEMNALGHSEMNALMSKPTFRWQHLLPMIFRPLLVQFMPEMFSFSKRGHWLPRHTRFDISTYDGFYL